IGYVEEGDDNVTIGLLELLRDQILVMPDNVAHNALPNVLTPESFIVMANHSNTKITTAVVKSGDWRDLLNYGLVESLLKALVCLIHQKKYVISDLCVPESNIIVCDINNFLSLIAIYAVQTSGSNNVNMQLERTLALFLWDIRYQSGISESDARVCEELSSKMEEWCSTQVLGLVNGSNVITVPTVLEACVEAGVARNEWREQHMLQVHKVVHKHEPLVLGVMERAERVTREVVSNQSYQRKLFLESFKSDLVTKVQAVFSWKQIVANLTHERAVWHFPDSYPRSWELDPTEGPARVRNRLRRCRLNIADKYFKPGRANASQAPPPLDFIFKESMSTSSVLIDRLHYDSKIRHMCKASVISPDDELPGELLIGHCCLYFVPTNMGAMDRDNFMAALLDCELHNRVASEPLGDAVDLWREGHLTNWHYLSILNTHSGRSYNDLMQYPVLPFILSDYTSSVLDLTDAKSFRSLWPFRRRRTSSTTSTIIITLIVIGYNSQINLVSISDTLGDIATVGQDPGGGSNLRLHSINGLLVGSVTTREQITALCFSSAPEGVSVNVVACGMCDGHIR
ncbi:unnamed protein product, partial [Nesidiocoris tenuis]